MTEMTAAEYLKTKSRICEKYKCLDICNEGCPLMTLEGQTLYLCTRKEREHPEEAITIVQKWAEGNPERTLLDDFLEKYPNAKMHENSIPFVCANHIYSVACIKSGHNCLCDACWSRPMEGKK